MTATGHGQLLFSFHTQYSPVRVRVRDTPRLCEHTYPNFLPVVKLSLILDDGGSPLAQLFGHGVGFICKKQHNRFYLENFCVCRSRKNPSMPLRVSAKINFFSE